jgi:glycosyltransferase involved in cell wall biosynthesis
MLTKLPVVAVIPAHNAENTLGALLDELIKQKYDGIFVIDDASSDSTAKIAASYGSKVNLIKGEDNVGSGANRNRIIGQTPPAILHFIDADMQLLSKDSPELIRQMDWPKDAAYIGGLVRNPDSTQNPFNYGPRPHILTGLFQGGLQFIIWQIGRLNKSTGKFLRQLSAPLLRGFPNIYAKPRPRHIHWVAESNMLIKSEVFAGHGGFDPRFRYSEIADLSLRVHRRGQHGYFDPTIDAVHGSLDNIFNSRQKRYVAHKQFLKKHGRLAYYLPPLADYFFTRKTQKRYHK